MLAREAIDDLYIVSLPRFDYDRDSFNYFRACTGNDEDGFQEFSLLNIEYYFDLKSMMPLQTKLLIFFLALDL
jgi:hypothetical protein